jgi:nicotinamidase-related amidase
MPSHIRPTSAAQPMTENAALVLVDQQEGLLGRVDEPEQTKRNLVALARCMRLLGVPAVLTTALAADPTDLSWRS